MPVFNKNSIFGRRKPDVERRAVRQAGKQEKPAAKSTPENSSHHFPGKYKSAVTPKPKPTDPRRAKMKAALARYEADDYSLKTSQGRLRQDHAQKRQDRELVREYRLMQAKEYHEENAPSVGAWISLAEAENRFGVLGTTVTRLSGEGLILTRSTGKALLVSVPTLEKQISDII